MELYERNASDLTEDEYKKLRAIKTPKDIKSCKQVGDDWTDDHVICMGVEINGVELGFWWCGSEMVGHVNYAMKNTEARELVFEALKSFMDLDPPESPERTVTVFSVEGETTDTVLDLVLLHQPMTNAEIVTKLREIVKNSSPEKGKNGWADLGEVSDEDFAKRGFNVVKEPHPFMKIGVEKSVDDDPE